MNGDGTATRRVAEELDVRGAPAWSPDGQWLAVAAANADGDPQLFKIPLDGGTPVPLVNGILDRSDLGSERKISRLFGCGCRHDVFGKAVSADGAPFPLRNLILTRGARRVAFLGDDALIIMKGDVSHKDFWRVDLKTGRERQLTIFVRVLPSAISTYLQMVVKSSSIGHAKNPILSCSICPIGDMLGPRVLRIHRAVVRSASQPLTIR